MYSRTSSRLTWMLDSVLGWSSFQDLWHLSVERLGEPKDEQALHLRRGCERLFVWRGDSCLYGRGSFDFDQPQGYAFVGEQERSRWQLPREGELGHMSDLVVGPAALRWVELDDRSDPLSIVGTDENLPDWPTFADQSNEFFDALLDHLHGRYWRSQTCTPRDFAWRENYSSAYLEKMPLYAGGHWQVYLMRGDDYRWLHEPRDTTCPLKFPTREAALEAALECRR